MLKYLDLFAGAGGLSEGFFRAGFDPVAHVEMDSAACYTLKTRAAYHWLVENNLENVYIDYLSGNISRDSFYSFVPESVLNSVLNYEISDNTLPIIFEKIDKLLGNNRLDMIIGGPPCQAYSLVGRARSETGMKGDKRNYLYKLYAEFLKKYAPQYFVFENVMGLLSAKDEDGTLHLENMRKLFKDYGYSTEYRLLNTSDYGVLQNRKRLILIGVKGNHVNFYPEIPVVAKQCVVNELFADLPSIQAGEGTPYLVPTKEYKGTYLFESCIKRYDKQPVSLHYARPHTDQDKEIYKIVVNAWNEHKKRVLYLDLPESLRTHKNLNSFVDRFKVVAGELQTSQTVVAHIARDGHYFIHPDIKQNRSITPREAARIQTFPDDFYFESKKGIPARTSAFRQIGNAVPVCFAHHIAISMMRMFEMRDINDEQPND